jgi:hypothetical protein
MKGSPGLAVVIPAGPADDVEDTVASVLHYAESPRTVVIVDDRHQHGESLGALSRMSPDVHVIPAPPRAPGSHGGLWVKIAAGYCYALNLDRFDLFLRLDTDAVVIGRGLEELARRRFESSPKAGLLGSYRIATSGGGRDWTWPARQLATECGARGLRHPHLRRLLREIRRLAEDNDYVAGEHVLGGAYVHSGDAVRSLAARGWLELPVLASSKLGEDHLFALLTVAAGYSIEDFGGPDDPLALFRRGLPAAPSDLLAAHKLVTHSVRRFQDLDERAIRAEFASARARDQ